MWSMRPMSIEGDLNEGDSDNAAPARQASSVDSIRAFCENILVSASSSDSNNLAPAREPAFRNSTDTQSLHVVTHWLCCVCGIIPFQVGACSAAYRLLPLCLTACMLVHCTAMSLVSLKETHVDFQYLSATVCGLGGVLGLAHFWLGRLHQLLGPHHRPLELYAAKYNFIYQWRSASLRCFVMLCATWLCMLIGRTAMLVGDYDRSLREVFRTEHIYIFGYLIGIVIMICFCFLHIFCGLELAIDMYCARLFETKDFGKGAAEWNILQALLRKSASTIDSCLLAVTTAMVGLLVLAGVEILTGSDDGRVQAPLWWVSCLPMMALTLYTCFRAAAITEKCQRVPALVNSWDFGGEGFEIIRQYTVRYITDSAAGFYVKGVRINALMALKLAYVFGTVMFALLTRTVFMS
eukprot:NODE_5183_length_1800_cov_3.346683.p1 GENE.NODE_5183_length_1800_cov_3.346683~~NODE_5183_length_1800_cov_3.346683.p1  ORF type:complete len:435 (+),score=53.89 NODE_5183_length_1800_cov_3.346683:84-1307(+)